MTGTLPPLLDSVVGGGTPGQSGFSRLWIQCCCYPGGEPKSIKKLRSGDLLIKTTSALPSKSFLLAKTFLDSTLTVSIHRTLNSCRIVIFEADLLCASETEILCVEDLSDQVSPSSSSSESQPPVPLVSTTSSACNSSPTSPASSSNKAISLSKISMYTSLPAETCHVVKLVLLYPIPYPLHPRLQNKLQKVAGK
ncbi:hypothetical protein TNCV_4206851 [Trichonephila clavipes]|nr:hypothetical protein TNCV_4206851 [Trichonephila clavipes]